MKTTRPANFHEWLPAQRHRDDPIGDLAADALADRNAPAQGTPDQWRSYLVRRGACWQAQAALEQALQEFYRRAGQRACPALSEHHEG